MKRILLFILLTLSVYTVSLSTHTVYASCENPTSEMDKVNCILDELKPSNAPNPLNIEDRSRDASLSGDSFSTQFRGIVGIITGVLASFSGIFAVVMLLKHAVRLITSEGDKGKIDEAKNGILYSLLGVIGIILAYSLVYTIIDVIYSQLG